MEKLERKIELPETMFNWLIITFESNDVLFAGVVSEHEFDYRFQNIPMWPPQKYQDYESAVRACREYSQQNNIPMFEN